MPPQPAAGNQPHGEKHPDAGNQPHGRNQPDGVHPSDGNQAAGGKLVVGVQSEDGNQAAGGNPSRTKGHVGGSGGSSPRASTAGRREADRRPASRANRLVGEEGFEPSRPFGHTDLNRARLPFRHPPWATSRLARPRELPRPGYDRGQGT